MIYTPRPKPLLINLKNSKKESVNKIRKNMMDAGITFRGSSYDTDSESLRNIAYWHLQVISGINLPAGFAWRDKNNIDHPADEDFIKELSLAATALGTQIYQASWLHKANIDALGTLSEVESYDISVGWPN